MVRQEKYQLPKLNSQPSYLSQNIRSQDPFNHSFFLSHFRHRYQELFRNDFDDQEQNSIFANQSDFIFNNLFQRYNQPSWSNGHMYQQSVHAQDQRQINMLVKCLQEEMQTMSQFKKQHQDIRLCAKIKFQKEDFMAQKVENLTLWFLPISKNRTLTSDNGGSLFFEIKCLKKMKEKLRLGNYQLVQIIVKQIISQNKQI